MKRTALIVLLPALITMVSSSWALSDRDQEGIDRLVSDSLASLTSQEPALWNLFSTQGSAAVMRSSDGVVAASRSKLKSDEGLAAAFVLPTGTTVKSQDLRRVGEFIIGRVTLSAQIEASQAGEVVGVPEPGDLWSAFWWDESRYRISRRAREAKPKTIEQEWQATLAAIQDGPQRSWRLVSLTVAPVEGTTDPAAVGGVTDAVRSWERSVMQGDLSELSQHLYDDPFCVAAYTPDGQAWFFNYPEYLTTMLGSALAMGSADHSAMVDLDVSISGPVATAIGQWMVDIPMLGSMNLGLTVSLIREDAGWMIVSMCGGMVE